MEDSTATEAADVPNKMQLMSEINEYREKIENSLGGLKKNQLDLSSARAEATDKWDSLHYYTDGEEIVRIKTYPSPSNAAKTEEFYFSGGELIFALEEKEGSGKTGKDGESEGEAYYYDDGELFASMTIGQSPADSKPNEEMKKKGEKLQVEADAYLQLIEKSKQ